MAVRETAAVRPGAAGAVKAGLPAERHAGREASAKGPLKIEKAHEKTQMKVYPQKTKAVGVIFPAGPFLAEGHKRITASIRISPNGW